MILNVTGGETCSYCGDDAQLLVGTETRAVFEYRDKQGRRVPSHAQGLIAKQMGTAEFEQYGPCPFCERGKLLEFPPPDKQGKERIGPWGKDGYWKGRSTVDLKRQASSFKKAPPSLVRDLLTNAGLLKGLE